MKIQLAIQGGGAKLVTLLGAASAIQDLQSDGRLELTRIVGTSAGAIVGTLLAAGVDLEAFRNELKAGTGSRLSASLAEPSKVRWCKTAMTGDAVWDTTVLKSVILDVLKARSERIGQPLRTLSDLQSATGIELRVIAADLRSPNPVVYKPVGNDKEIVTALLDSAGIPFFFRTWRHGSLVDGGLVQNFAWEELLDSDSSHYGPIIGVSFASEARDIPATRAGYAKALLNTAMDSATERARFRLGSDRVLSLGSEYDTFDFRAGFAAEALTNHFALVKGQTRTWFESKLRSSGIAIESDPWSTGSVSMMEKLGRMYELQHRKTLLKYHAFTLEIAGFGLLRTGEADVITYSFSFSTTDKDVYCHTVALSQTKKNSGFFRKSEITFTDSAGQVISTDYLPVFDPKTPEKREVLLFFDRPLPAASGPYTLKIRDVVEGLTADLLKDGHDVLFTRTQRTATTIDSARLVMHLPANCAGAQMAHPVNGSSSQVVGRAMPPAELIGFQSPAPGWITLGWMGEDVQPNEHFGPSIQL